MAINTSASYLATLKLTLNVDSPIVRHQPLSNETRATGDEELHGAVLTRLTHAGCSVHLQARRAVDRASTAGILA